MAARTHDTDAIDLLMNDHQRVDALFEEYESLNGGGPSAGASSSTR